MISTTTTTSSKWRKMEKNGASQRGDINRAPTMVYEFSCMGIEFRYNEGRDFGCSDVLNSFQFFGV